MAEAILTISGPSETRQIELRGEGVVIGRSPNCDVVLEGIRVSRAHARIFQDPFDRWIVEDMSSRNGVLVNNKRITACAVLPGEPIAIGAFCLSITQSGKGLQIEPDDLDRTTTATIVEDDRRGEIISGEDTSGAILSRWRLKRLNEIMERLSELTSSAALYSEVCRSLARAARTVAAVLRLPGKAQSLPTAPEMLACCFGDDPDNITGKDTDNLCLSRRALEGARSTGRAVMAQSVQSAEGALTLTVVDEHNPRAVICAPVSILEDTMDLLYVDIPLDENPLEMFDFIQAVSRQAGLARNSLLLMEVKAEYKLLDHQLSLAREIQSSLAPKIPSLSGVDLSACYQPALWVGGDYCEVWPLEDGRVVFALGDVSGKGLPAAMVMSNLQAALRTTMSFCTEPSEVMQRVNRHLQQHLTAGMFITLFLGLFDPAAAAIKYVNAGHLPPFIIEPPSTVKPLGEPDDPVLGVMDACFHTHDERLNPACGLLVFSDGITEARSPEREEFGLERVMNLLKGAQTYSARHITDLVAAAVKDFRQSLAQQDDITIFTLFNHDLSKSTSASSV